MNDRLRLKFEEPFSQRKVGGFCYHLFRALCTVCSEHQVPMQPMPYVTSKKPGRLALRIGRGYSIALRFQYDEDLKEVIITPDSKAKYPSWIDSEKLKSIVADVSETLSL